MGGGKGRVEGGVDIEEFINLYDNCARRRVNGEAYSSKAAGHDGGANKGKRGGEEAPGIEPEAGLKQGVQLSQRPYRRLRSHRESHL